MQVTPVNEILIRYINRLEDDIQRLNKEASAYRSNPCGTDIKKAIHDASNMLGLLKTYKITDPDIVAVEWVLEAAKEFVLLRGCKP